jgi:hypothetical protein
MKTIVSRQKKGNSKMTTKSESLGEEKNSEQTELMKKYEELASAFGELTQKLEKMQETKKVSVEDIKYNDFVKVMSLIGNKLNLSTQPHGKGKIFSFERFGETRNIMYADLMEINNNQRNFLEAGYYYILDDRVVEAEGLTDIYEKILSKSQIEEILSNKAGAIALFQKANPKQRNVVINFICEKLINGEQVDFNLVNEIDRVVGQLDRNYVNINTRVNNTKEALAKPEK